MWQEAEFAHDCMEACGMRVKTVFQKCPDLGNLRVPETGHIILAFVTPLSQKYH
jgi:hypothetical protein